MIYIALIIALSILWIFSIIKNKKITKDIIYLSSKLNSIIDNDTDENLKVFTDEYSLKGLLNEVNRLLDFNKERKAESNRQDKSMKRMLSNISHDLKTPLTVIIGYVEMMLLDRDMDEIKHIELLNMVQSKSNELVLLINKFFVLAKLDSEDLYLAIVKYNNRQSKIQLPV